MNKLHFLAIPIYLFLASCSQENYIDRQQKGEDWLRAFAKEQFKEDAKHLVSYELKSANDDSTQLIYIVQKLYNGEKTEMPPFTIFLNKKGDVDDKLTRTNL